ncbi:MAG: HIT domain-containing protein [Candidatus Hydrogenedens sp.]|nr:HIT domain-containing protein [Candidatus Hydrogenedens sp.]
MGDEETIFGKILKGEMPSQEVYSDEHTYAFRDVNPAAPTHVLVIPRKPIPKISDISEADAELMGRLMFAANKVAELEGLKESGYRLVINCGAGAGQTVFHLHVHVLGGREFAWPPG